MYFFVTSRNNRKLRALKRHDRSKYHGPFHPDPNYQPERFRRGYEYPENVPRANTILPSGGLNPLDAKDLPNRNIHLVSLISDQPKSSTQSLMTKSSTTNTTSTTTTEPTTSSRRALPRVSTTKAAPSPKAPSGGGSKREPSVSSLALSNVEWHVRHVLRSSFAQLKRLSLIAAYLLRHEQLNNRKPLRSCIMWLNPSFKKNSTFL